MVLVSVSPIRRHNTNTHSQGLHCDVLPPESLNPIPHFVGKLIFKKSLADGRTVRGLDIPALDTVVRDAYCINQQWLSTKHCQPDLASRIESGSFYALICSTLGLEDPVGKPLDGIVVPVALAVTPGPAAAVSASASSEQPAAFRSQKRASIEADRSVADPTSRAKAPLAVVVQSSFLSHENQVAVLLTHKVVAQDLRELWALAAYSFSIERQARLFNEVPLQSTTQTVCGACGWA